MSKPSDLVQGTLDMLILKILALQALNGWAIHQRLQQISSDVLGVSDGSHEKSFALTWKKRPMMAAVCSQSRVSACSSFCPDRVSR